MIRQKPEDVTTLNDDDGEKDDDFDYFDDDDHDGKDDNKLAMTIGGVLATGAELHNFSVKSWYTQKGYKCIAKIVGVQEVDHNNGNF